jgi:hypothetical protein
VAGGRRRFGRALRSAAEIRSRFSPPAANGSYSEKIARGCIFPARQTLSSAVTSLGQSSAGAPETTSSSAAGPTTTTRSGRFCRIGAPAAPPRC